MTFSLSSALVLAVHLAAAGPRPVELDTPPLTFAVLPGIDAPKIEREYAPLVAELQTALGRPVTLVVPDDYADIVHRMISGEVNIALLSPYIYAGVQADVQKSVVTQWRMADPKALRGLCVAKDEGAVTTLAEAAGKRVAFVHVASTSGYLMPRLAMRTQGVDFEKHFAERLFAGSHDKAFDMVMAGQAELACVSARSLAKKKGYRVVLETEPAVDDVLLAHRGVSDAERERLKGLFLAKTKSAKLTAFMKAQGIAAFVAPDLSVYDAVLKEIRR